MADCRLGEKGCWKDGKCHYGHDCENKVLTNADRIRAMDDGELSEFLCGVYDCNGADDKFICGAIIPQFDECSVKEWLKQPVEE